MRDETQGSNPESQILNGYVADSDKDNGRRQASRANATRGRIEIGFLTLKASNYGDLYSRRNNRETFEIQHEAKAISFRAVYG
jgi:hypothetical protein